MGKSSRRSDRGNSRGNSRGSYRTNDRARSPQTDEQLEMSRVERKPRINTPLEPMNEAQRLYMASINANTVTFGLGPIGTGKTYIAAAMAADAFLNKTYKKIIITRPAVEAGESLGFLPGEIDDKFGPYFEPVRQVLEARLGSGHLEAAVASGKIVVLPLAYMRGHTFDDAWVLLDEAQNTTPKQMYMFLTRIGENSKVVIDGDLKQLDISGASGLKDAITKLRGVKSIGRVDFTLDDIVRSGLAKDIATRYSCDEENTHDEARFTNGNTPAFMHDEC